MGTVNLPTPVVIAIGGMCLLAGYLLGIVAGPDGPERTTGTVDSFDPDGNVLCLSGDAVAELENTELDGEADDVLCGSWERAAGSVEPEPGDDFRFVTERTGDAPEGEESERAGRVLIYGAVVD